MLAILLSVFYIVRRVWEQPACHGSGLPSNSSNATGDNARGIWCSREAVQLWQDWAGGKTGCAYLDVEPHAGQVLWVSWLEFRRGESLVLDRRFRVVGRMSVADEPTWREGFSSCGEQT